jgi:hypothetical protein
MYLDDLLKLADAQESTATVASTSYIDTLAKGDSYEGAWLYIRIDTAVDSAGGAGTVNFALETDSDSGFATNLKTLVSTGVIAEATLIKGYEAKVRIPPGALRYLRGYVTIAGEALTAGKWDMYIVKDVDINSNRLA